MIARERFLIHTLGIGVGSGYLCPLGYIREASLVAVIRLKIREFVREYIRFLQ